MRFGLEGVVVLGVAVEKAQPLGINAVHQRLVQRVVFQHRKAGVVQAGNKCAWRIGVQKINDWEVRGVHDVHGCYGAESNHQHKDI